MQMSTNVVGYLQNLGCLVWSASYVEEFPLMVLVLGGFISGIERHFRYYLLLEIQ